MTENERQALLTRLIAEREQPMARWHTPAEQWQPQPMPTDELLAEIEHLRGTDRPVNIASRLGMSPQSIERRLDRAGRHDIAVDFRPARVRADAA